MIYGQALDMAGNLAAIATATVAVFAYWRYVRERIKKRQLLERHLRDELGIGYDGGQLSVHHLMANLRMSESDVLAAAFRSDRVRCLVRLDEEGPTRTLLFEYDDDEERVRLQSGKKR